MTDGMTISTDNAPSPVGRPVPGPILDDSGDVITYDFAAQCHAAFANVRAVLESAGISLDDLIDVTVYLTDIKRDCETYNGIYAEYFSTDGPCRTTVDVNRHRTKMYREFGTDLR